MIRKKWILPVLRSKNVVLHGCLVKGRPSAMETSVQLHGNAHQVSKFDRDLAKRKLSDMK